MIDRFLLALWLAGLSSMCMASERDQVAGTNDNWKVVSQQSGVTIYARPHPGSSLKEFRAIGEIDGPVSAVSRVLEDVDGYPHFMPYMAECRVLTRGNGWVVSYQRISPKICADRDFTLRSEVSTRSTDTGRIYSNRWETANYLGPAKKPRVIRVQDCHGSWLLESIMPDRTRATYSVYTDIGGLIPAFLANHFSQSAIREVFAALRKQAEDPKYNPGLNAVSH